MLRWGFCYCAGLSTREGEDVCHVCFLLKIATCCCASGGRCFSSRDDLRDVVGTLPHFVPYVFKVANVKLLLPDKTVFGHLLAF